MTSKRFEPIGPKDGVQVIVTDVGKVVTEDILKQYEIKPAESTQVEAETWTPTVLEPPHNLAKLMGWMDINTVHSSCVRVKTQDSVGIGYYLEHDDEKIMQGRERDSNYLMLMKFFNMVNAKENVTQVLKKVFLDYEGNGNSYIEVSRGSDNKINALFHVNSTTVRWAKTKDKLIQKVGNNYVWFKPFGETRILNKITGNFVQRIDPNKAANEIIPIKQYSWKSTLYGMPEWLPSLYAMFGDMKETEYNIDFFMNYGVPAYAILVKGASLTPEVHEEINKYFETTLKGSNHKTLTLSTPKGAELKFERLSVETKEASFRVYKQDNRDEILTAHHVPPYRVGIVKQGQLGGNVAVETDRIYLDSVINPRQKEFAWVINELIIRQGLEIEGWQFKFEDINIADAKTDSEIYNRYFNMGAMTPNEVRKELGLDPYDGGDAFYIPSNLIPVGLVEGKEEGGEGGVKGTTKGISDEERREAESEYPSE